jgi:hypothetical protein
MHDLFFNSKQLDITNVRLAERLGIDRLIKIIVAKQARICLTRDKKTLFLKINCVVYYTSQLYT